VRNGEICVRPARLEHAVHFTVIVIAILIKYKEKQASLDRGEALSFCLL
jgi:hypothetical protein